MTFPIPVVIADDHPVLLIGITHALEKSKTIQLIGKARNSTELITVLDKYPCSVVICDYAMPGGDYGDGIGLFTLLQRRYPDLHLVVLTMIDNPGIIRLLLQQGIQCIVSKLDSSDLLIAAVQAAYVQGSYFSPTIANIVAEFGKNQTIPQPSQGLSGREAEVIRLFICGLTVNEIALHLHRSKKTVSAQKMNAMRKLGIQRDADLIRYAHEIDSSPPPLNTQLLPSFLSTSLRNEC